MQCSGQNVSGLSFNPRVFVKNAKICFFEEKWFRVKFISNLSAVGNKPQNNQALEILTKVVFMHVLKYHIFRNF